MRHQGRCRRLPEPVGSRGNEGKEGDIGRLGRTSTRVRRLMAMMLVRCLLVSFYWAFTKAGILKISGRFIFLGTYIYITGTLVSYVGIPTLWNLVPRIRHHLGSPRVPARQSSHVTPTVRQLLLSSRCGRMYPTSGDAQLSFYRARGSHLWRCHPWVRFPRPAHGRTAYIRDPSIESHTCLSPTATSVGRIAWHPCTLAVPEADYR